MNKKGLLAQIGDVSQIGGIRSFTFNNGKARDVRAIEINTGKICFTVLPDRCMDIATAAYKGENVSWISKTGIVSPAFYEKDGKGFLRSFYGGLLTTCGLRNIGRPYAEFGLHGRIANIPAQNVSVFSDWVGGEYIMKVSGKMRESEVFGENLVLKRTITAKLFEEEFTIEDTVINEGFREENTALCYHCNFGYPLVREGAKIINVPEEFSHISAPTHGKEEECIDLFFADDVVTTGIENSEIGAYITHRRDTLPDYVIWKMEGESEYVIGLEPRTTRYGGENINKHGKYVVLKPFEKFNTELKFSFKTLK